MIMTAPIILLTVFCVIMMCSMFAMLCCYSKLPPTVSEMTKISVWKEYGTAGKLFVVFSWIMIFSGILLMIDVGFFIR